MSEKNIVLTCIWRSDEFVVTNEKIEHLSDEAVLLIDENAEKVIVKIPGHLSLINKKIIERRVQSITKTGFSVPNTQIRIGMGFEVEITKDEVIPEVLLQEGHKYSLDRPEFVADTPSQPILEEKPEIELEYVPTFLKQEQLESDTQPIVKTIAAAEADFPQEPPKVVEVTKQPVESPESIAGRFVIALSNTGDVYLTRKDDHYSIEYSAGRVDFDVRNGDIQILLTKRISTDDQTLEQARLAATKKLQS